MKRLDGCRFITSLEPNERWLGHIEGTDERDPELIICAGPPTCMFQGDAAIENAEAGCTSCRRIVLHNDGSETEYRRRSQ